jgi:terminase large subunit-like protein
LTYLLLAYPRSLLVSRNYHAIALVVRMVVDVAEIVGAARGVEDKGTTVVGERRVMLELRNDLRLALDRLAFAKKLGMAPDSWQEKLLHSAAPRVLLNCSRQSGKSTISAILALHRALYHPGSLVLVLAPALRQSQELFGKVASFYCAMSRPIPAQAEGRLSLELENGSRIVTLPGTDKTIRGFSGATLLIVDEAARVEDELYFAVRPMLAVSDGALIMLTTPHGKRGIFFEEWTSGHGWECYEVKAEECPRISPEFLEEERQVLPSWVYRQEYECSFEETEDAVFTYSMVEQAVSSEVTPLFGRG